MGEWVNGGRGLDGEEVLDEGDVGSRRLHRRRRPCVRFSAAVARAVCRRVASGESMNSICRDEDMPSRPALTVWARTIPKFRRALSRAREAGGWGPGGHPPPHYCEQAASEIFARMCEGEALTSICADPGMPGHSTVYRWRAAEPAFAQAMILARQVQAEKFCDLGWEIASGVLPETAFATQVKLQQLRWTAAAMAPRRYGKTFPVESEEVVEMQALRRAEVNRQPRYLEVVLREPDGSERTIGLNVEAYSGEVEVADDVPEWMQRVREQVLQTVIEVREEAEEGAQD